MSSWISLEYSLHELRASLEAGRARESLDAASKLDPQRPAALEQKALAAQLEKIKTRLRRVPYWRSGHIKAARIYLKLADSPGAYAAALAAEKLSKSGSTLLESRRMLAKSLLAGNDIQRALVIYEKLLQQRPNDAAIKEDLAACYLAADRQRDALSLLSSIAQDEMSPASKEAYLYLKNKIND